MVKILIKGEKKGEQEGAEGKMGLGLINETFTCLSKTKKQTKLKERQTPKI